MGKGVTRVYRCEECGGRLIEWHIYVMDTEGLDDDDIELALSHLEEDGKFEGVWKCEKCGKIAEGFIPY